MPLLRTVRRLLSHAAEDWAEVARELFAPPTAAPGPRPLRVMRLERRRVLSADFSLVGGGLVLDGFDAEDASLEISQQGDAYEFTTDEGWETLDGPLPAGVRVEGETLSIDRALLESLPNGLSVVGDGTNSLSVMLGNADFSGLDGPVSLISPTAVDQQPLALFTAPSEGVQLASAPSGLTLGSLSVAGNLEITAFGEITDGPNTQILVSGNATLTTRTGGDAITAGITLADNPGDRFEVGGEVLFDAIEGGSRYDIDIGSGGWTEFGGVTALGGQVTIVEDAPTQIDRIDATGFSLTAAGTVEATAGATIDVTDDASITSTGSRFRADFNGDRAVTNADYDAWAAGFGTSDATRADGDANGDGSVNAADYTVWRDSLGLSDQGGGIDVSMADRFEVGDEVTLLAQDGSDRYAVTADNPTGNRFGSLLVVGSTVVINEDFGGSANGTLLRGVDASSFQLDSRGPITDTADAALLVSGDASIFSDGGPITLADTDNAANRFEVGGLASIAAAVGLDVSVGVDPTTGDPVGSNVEFGRTFIGAAMATARLAVDSDALFVGAEAGTLSVHSAGEVLDTADALILVVGDASFFGAEGITLADAATNANTLDVGTGNARFEVGPGRDIEVGVNPADGTPADAQVILGSLTFVAPGGDVRIALDNRSLLASTSEAGTLELLGTEIRDEATANLRVDGTASLVAPIIDLGHDASNTTQFGSLAIDGTTVSIQENAPGGDATPGTLLTNVQAGTLSLASGGPITDDNAGMITVGDLASFDAGTSDITLDGPAVNFGRVSLVGGAVSVAEASGTLLNGVQADTLMLTSAGQLTDEATAVIEVAGEATLFAATGITLADAPTMDNRVVVGGFAQFAVNAGQDIDLGVLANGMPADAILTTGSISFDAQGGNVRIAEDADTLLGGASLAQALRLGSAGAITDTADADTEVTRSAELNANGGASDVVLGDASARFSLGTPDLFNPAEYLAIAANNVSVQADSGVNVRTSAADPSFRGTYHVAARGNISQVGGTDGSIRSLTAERVSLSGTGAVLFSGVELTSDDATLPNLQIEAGTPIDLADEVQSVGVLANRFGSDQIPTAQETAFSPAEVEADVADGTRPDQPNRSDAGLENVLVGDRFSRIVERTPDQIDIGDAYSAVVLVVGDAIVGDVQDATGAASDESVARGLVVANTGNAYLDTTGSLTFTGEGRFEQASEVEVVAMSGGVLTAIAGTVLKIDTEEADQPTSVARTTKLRSATGVVTNLSDQSGEDTAPGPRLRLDPSTEDATAATTGLVRADQDFEQRLTVAVGSRGEDNLLVEVEWADVAGARETSDARPSIREAFSSTLVGSNALPDLIQTPVDSIEATEASTAATGLEYQELDGVFRVVTIRHNYLREFVPVNPAQDTLPTTLRVFNDPAINLFDQGGARDLNSASLAIAPRIITLPPAGFFMLSEPDLPAEYTAAEPAIARSEPTSGVQRSSSDEGRAAVVSSAESIEFGRIDESGEWIKDLPGETWPQVRDDAEGDFLREIREKIDEGPYSEGEYRIQVRTPRGEQILEQWTKGDVEAEATEAAFDNELPPGELLNDDLPGDELPKELPFSDEFVPADEANPFDSDELLPIGNGRSGATEAAFAAIAAVGVWRRRLGDEGRLRLDSDGVAYTRASRRRRRGKP